MIQIVPFRGYNAVATKLQVFPKISGACSYEYQGEKTINTHMIIYGIKIFQGRGRQLSAEVFLRKSWNIHKYLLRNRINNMSFNHYGD